MREHWTDYVYGGYHRDHGLGEGEWTRDGLILRWVPRGHDDQPQVRDITSLVACPTCHVTLDEQCRTSTGRDRAPHSSRLVARRCGCGGRLAAGKKVCASCRADARRENGRVGMQNTRARRREAA